MEVVLTMVPKAIQVQVSHTSKISKMSVKCFVYSVNYIGLQQLQNVLKRDELRRSSQKRHLSLAFLNTVCNFIVRII